jgi:hypothetical protein
LTTSERNPSGLYGRTFNSSFSPPTRTPRWFSAPLNTWNQEVIVLGEGPVYKKFAKDLTGKVEITTEFLLRKFSLSRDFCQKLQPQS